MAKLVSLNVGLPRDIEWRGRTVRTGIWKDPVQGRRRVDRLNVRGDGQGDLAGHGGEQRAVLAYQIDSYRFWQEQLKRSDFVLGQFGENFTIEGLPDHDVCVGDRYRIGGALFEVTQPRVTCYRVGIRMNEPRMAALLTASGRPGFYLRVLQEGEVGAGDEIVKVGEAQERMTVAEINALLYSSAHPREQLDRALRIGALSPGWRWSFTQLAEHSTLGAAGGNAGLAPTSATRPAAPGFRTLTVVAIDRDSEDVLSLTMRSQDGRPLPVPLAGQYVVLRLQPTMDGGALFRSFSLSGDPSEDRYRISIKVEPNGVAGNYLRQHAKVGDVLDVSSPRGTFTLRPATGPVVLLSAGIGLTPVLAMLFALADSRSTRQVWWLHGARDRQHHPFAEEVNRLLGMLPHAHRFICYSDPLPDDSPGTNFDGTGRLTQAVFEQVAVPHDADVYLCGPPLFMTGMRQALTAIGVEAERIHSEIFSGIDPMTPGVIGGKVRVPHPPKDDTTTGPLVSFARSGIAAHWNSAVYESILELAEACDVPVRWSCRTGVCHSCESGLISGLVSYDPDPLDAPASGNVLLCCSRPQANVVIDI